ncbi:MAG: hypothetical protein ACUZ8H_05755 [Candidatus Anammoxibacter sp.]
MLNSDILNITALKMHCIQRASDFVEVLSRRLDRTGESWVRFLPKIFIFKFALTLVALLITVTLFISHIDLFEPITAQFSEWVSSSIIAFTISIIVVKFVVVAACLAMYAFKPATLENVVARLKGLSNVRFPVFISRRRTLNL